MTPKFFATLGLVIGIFLEALEGTVVATAMPAIVRDLGSPHLYALPFSIYLLIQTVSSPLWGRASDLVSRKALYLAGVIVYLIGSAASGAAHSMAWLIAMRIVQGIGAGCLLTLTFTLIGEMYPLHQRARVQGYISGVWGIAGLLGPMMGGYIADHHSWRWLFYLNLPFGIVAFLLCAMFLKEDIKAKRKFRMDIPGAILLVVGVGALVWGLDQKTLGLTLTGLVLSALALPFEFRHPAPLLPVQSLRNVISRSSLLNNLLAGAAYFGAVAYIPLYVQHVAGANATMSGIVLTPMVVGWTVANIIAGRILHKVALDTINTLGFLLLTLGFVGFVVWMHAGIHALAAMGSIAGFGMGFGMLTTLLLVQNHSPREELGSATAAAFYARTIGGSLGVSLISLAITETHTDDPAQLVTEFRQGFSLSLLLAAIALWVSLFKIRPAARCAQREKSTERL